MFKEILKPRYVVICLGFLFLIPVLVNLLLFSWTTSITFVDSKTWLGFFGSYIGSIIGGFLTLLGVVMTIKAQSVGDEKEEEKRKIRILSLLTDELEINYKKLVKLEGIFDNCEYPVVCDESMLLNQGIWNQVKSEALILLDIKTIKRLVVQYELLAKYNESAQKNEKDCIEITEIYKRNKEHLELILKEIVHN